jgi:tRNA U34 2-thiouridine synthase MnmA/TrmU
MHEDLLNVKMNDSDGGIAPGQFAVFYDNEVCLGGGIILEDLN